VATLAIRAGSGRAENAARAGRAMSRREAMALVPALVLLTAACATGPRPAPQVRTATLEERARIARVLTPLLVALDYPLDDSTEALRLKNGCLIGLGVLVSDRLNAAVGPGRTVPCASFHLLVSEGALRTLPEDSLQAMLAHELGHVHLGHFAQAESRQRQRERADPEPGDSERTVDMVAVADGGAMTTPELAMRALRREDEAEADQFAATLLRRVGGAHGRQTCLALVDLLARLEARGQPRPAEWLATHPSPARRAETIRAGCEAGGLALPRDP